MRTFVLLILLTLLCITNCCTNEIDYESDLTICKIEDANLDFNSSNILIDINDIVGYDQTNYVFELKESAWSYIENIVFSNAEPFYKIGFYLGEEFIYSATFVQPYISASYNDIITFTLLAPDLLYVKLGYPGFDDSFDGEDNRNDERLISYLKSQNKLIDIE